MLDWLTHRFAYLDVGRVRTLYGLDGYIVRFELTDGRYLELHVEPSMAYSNQALLADWLEQTARRELTKAFRCCTEHDDCASLPELGRACWTQTHGSVPSRGTGHD